MAQRDDEIILYDYWRSSASYRVRIALNLKRLAWRAINTSLIDGGQKSPAYLEMNPQGLVPTLHIDGMDLTQSLAILEYLDHKQPDPPLFPASARSRARALAHAMIIIADIHPVNNLRMLQYLKGEMGQDDQAVGKWYRHWIIEGFGALERHAPEQGFFGGETPNIVDICLVPQVYNARRFDTPLADFPHLVRIDAACNALEAFERARPEAVQP